MSVHMQVAEMTLSGLEITLFGSNSEKIMGASNLATILFTLPSMLSLNKETKMYSFKKYNCFIKM